MTTLSTPCWAAAADTGSTAQIGLGNPVVAMALTALITTLVFLLLDWRRKQLHGIIFSALPVQVMVFNGKGRVLYNQCNASEGTTWAKGIRTLSDLPADSRDSFREKLLTVLAEGADLTHDNVLIRGRHYRVVMQILPRRILGDDCVLCLFSDISELHHERQHSMALAERFAATVEAIGDAVLATDQDGTVTLANTACSQLLGRAAEDIVGRAYIDVLPLLNINQHQPLAHPIQRALQQKHDIRRYSHFRLHTRDGRQLHITGTATPIYDGCQRLNGAVMAFRDETDDFHQRTQLSVQNSLLQAAAAVAEMSYFHTDCTGTIQASVAKDFWGRRGDGTRLPAEEWIHPDDQEAFKNAWESLCARRSESMALTFRNRDRLSTRIFELKANAMTNAVSGEREIIGYIRDVTNLRRNEQLNYDTMLLLQEIIDNLPCYISVNTINDQFSPVLSNTMHQALPDNARLAKDSSSKDTQNLQAILDALRDDDRQAATMDQPSEKIAQFVAPDLSIHQGKFFRKVLTRANGEKTLLGLMFDISDEIARETQLQETNTLFQAVLNTLPCILFVKDFYADDRFVISNRYYHQLLGLPDGAMIGKTNYDFFPATHADKYTSDDGVVMSSGQELELVEELPCAGGRIITINVVKTCIHRQSGHNLLLGIGFDATELHDSRNQLQAVNGVLTGILENLPAIIAAKNANDEYRYVAWNKAAETLYGVGAEDIVGHNDSEIAIFKPLAEKYRQEELLLAKTGSIRKNQHLRAPDGSEHELTVEVRHVQTPSSSLVLIMGFDVTQEKRREAERIKLSEQLEIYVQQERLFNSCLESILLSDDDDVALQNVQRTIAKWFGANRSCIFQFDESNHCFTPVIEWTSPSLIGRAKPLMAITLPADDPWFQHFNDEPVIIIPNIHANHVQQVFGTWGDIFSSTRVASVCAAALTTREKLWGFIGFAFSERRDGLSPEDEQMLLSAAHIIEIILERRHNREKLTRSEYEKRLILDTIQIPILLFDAQHQLLRVNNAGVIVAGVDEDLLYRDPCFLTFCLKHERPEDCPLALTIADHQTHNKEARIKDRDYLITSHPIFIEQELVYILETMVDISEAKTVQHKLQQALLEAQNANKAKSYFLANISHELRTPLNAVIGFSELLRGSKITNDERNEYLRSINLAGKALLNLINDVLDLSKIEADQMVIVPQPTEIPSLAQEILAIFKHRTHEKGLHFNIDFSKDIPILLLDTLRLRQILLNLVGNAVKFTDHGSITVCITFATLDHQQGTLNIVVADTGCGIRPEYRKRIFQPFEQQDSVRDSAIYHGSGLGLAISHRLVLRMGGTIDVVSAPGQGSEFRVTLRGVPYTTPQLVDSATPIIGQRQLDHADNASGSGRISPKGHRTYQHLRVLIADDVPMNLQVLSAMLKKMGVIAMTATNGRDVLQTLSSSTVPNVLLTDMWMPDMNGSQLAKRIREKDRFDAMKIIAVTADAEVRSSFDMHHFDQILLKPITFDKLEELFNSL